MVPGLVLGAPSGCYWRDFYSKALDSTAGLMAGRRDDALGAWK